MHHENTTLNENMKCWEYLLLVRLLTRPPSWYFGFDGFLGSRGLLGVHSLQGQLDLLGHQGSLRFPGLLGFQGLLLLMLRLRVQDKENVDRLLQQWIWNRECDGVGRIII